ncbi:YhcN/YlaJ family sporulation lipoprotein [Peribacillus simplex]|uniref:YhcN/YlaJ family sporulation lipoprotein n=1 Tax=Peribacillus TaxID=2675229 RepID=UPI001786C001|nr:YhcN/YlaJ family sporulation lipoprotein [Brevibacillus sp. JNUCC-41]QOS89230.1 YhcN/YlaJ family sporulation lipoprotein [Brevibacillus sp. JNUCC-41]
MKYTFLTSALIALFLTGCGTNDNNNDGKNVGMNTRSNQNDAFDNTLNVNDRNGDNDHNARQLNNDDNDNKMRVADEVANRLEDMDDVKGASVIVTDNNAYVAVDLTNDKNLTNDLEKKIVDQVKKHDQGVDNVYVSANPDFVKSMKGYVNDIQNGKPISGLFNEFGDMAQRMFPDAK